MGDLNDCSDVDRPSFCSIKIRWSKKEVRKVFEYTSYFFWFIFLLLIYQKPENSRLIESFLHSKKLNPLKIH